MANTLATALATLAPEKTRAQKALVAHYQRYPAHPLVKEFATILVSISFNPLASDKGFRPYDPHNPDGAGKLPSQLANFASYASAFVSWRKIADSHRLTTAILQQELHVFFEAITDMEKQGYTWTYTAHTALEAMSAYAITANPMDLSNIYAPSLAQKRDQRLVVLYHLGSYDGAHLMSLVGLTRPGGAALEPPIPKRQKGPQRPSPSAPNPPRQPSARHDVYCEWHEAHGSHTTAECKMKQSCGHTTRRAWQQAKAGPSRGNKTPTTPAPAPAPSG